MKTTIRRIWRILPAETAHIPFIAANMREADRREVWASNRHTPGEALRWSLLYADRAWTCLLRRETGWQPAFMWGVSRHGCLLDRTGVPWLLGTDGVFLVKREFLKQSRAYVERMQAGYDRLENKIHAGNALSMRWLVWCGFTLAPEPEVSNGELFYRFWRERSCVHSLRQAS